MLRTITSPCRMRLQRISSQRRTIRAVMAHTNACASDAVQGRRHSHCRRSRRSIWWRRSRRRKRAASTPSTRCAWCRASPTRCRSRTDRLHRIARRADRRLTAAFRTAMGRAAGTCHRRRPRHGTFSAHHVQRNISLRARAPRRGRATRAQSRVRECTDVARRLPNRAAAQPPPHSRTPSRDRTHRAVRWRAFDSVAASAAQTTQ